MASSSLCGRDDIASEVGMRARDVRAISFCEVTIIGLFGLVLAVLHNFIVAFGLAAAYAALILTRPRMIRVFRRLNGEPDWSGYFDNGGRSRGGPSTLRAPGGSASSPRPVERR